MSDEMESMWKEAVVACFKVPFRSLPVGIVEITKNLLRIVDVGRNFEPETLLSEQSCCLNFI
jgi:hypothetical protein